MRWKEPVIGDIRVINKFPIFPLTIDNKTFWLEKIKVKQLYKKGYEFSTIVHDFVPVFYWKNIEILD